MINTNLLKSYFKLRDMRQDEIANAIGMNPSTFSQKINNEPGYVFSVDEALSVSEVLGIKKTDMSNIFFAKKLA